MSFDYQKFTEILATGPMVRPTFDERTFLQQSAKILILSFSDLDPQTRSVVMKDMRFLLKKVGIYKACFINSLLFNLTKERKYIKKSLDLLRKLPVSLADHINDFWALSLLLRDGDDADKAFLSPEERREYLTHLNAKAVNKAKATFEKISVRGRDQSAFSKNQRVVLITSQLLAMGHAPTEITLNYARILQKKHGKEVLLVSSCEYSAKPSGAITSPFVANAQDNYSNFTSISYEGETFGLFQPSPAICSDEGIQQCMNKIDVFDPALIIIVGNSCGFADVFVPRSYVIYSPTANTVPFARDAKFHMHDAPSEAHLALMAEENILHNYEFFQPGAYEVQTKRSSTTRQELGLPEERPVFIIVGNRLSQEVTEEFLGMLNEIGMHTDAFFFFLGEFAGYDSLKESWPKIAENSINHKYLHDIMAVYEHCDAYLNPKRKGGGTSAVYAMQAGVPVLSLPYGDVSFTAAQFPVIESFDAMAQAAINLSADTAAMVHYRELAKEGCKSISGLSGVIGKILEHYEQYAPEQKPLRELAG